MRSSLLRAAVATVVVASMALTSNAQTIGCELGGTGGPLPSSGTGGGGTFPTTLPTFPSNYTLNVASIPAGATVVTAVNINGFTHTWMSDVQLVLTDPSGVSHNLFCRQGGSCDFNGNYTIVPACTGGTAWPSTCVNPNPPGSYDQFFGTGSNAWPSGTNNIFNTPLDSIPAATGVWTLTGYDWVGSDAGAVTSWDLCFGTPIAPAAPSAAPALTAPAAGATVYGPYINLTWGAVGCATSYEVDVDGVIYPTASASLVYSSVAGPHTWTVRGVNSTGAGPWAVARAFTDGGLATPTLSSPANAANVNGPIVNLTWVALPNVSSYDVDVDGVVTSVATNSYAFPSTLGLHTWTVRALWNANTIVGPYATPRTFTDIGLPVPTLSTPAAGASVFGPNVNLTWVAVANASGYDVDVDGTVYSTATNSYVFASTPGVHNWTVRALWNSNTLIGPYATPRSFTDLGPAPSPCNGPSLSTLFATNNGLSSGSCCYFDVNVLNPNGIRMSQLDQNTTSTVGTAFSVTIYTKPGTYVGSEQIAANWTLTASGAGIAAGSNQPSLVEFPDFTLAPGITGFCVVITGVSNSYTNGTATNAFYANADLTITLGKSQSVPFSPTSTPISPRIWNGALRYDCPLPITTYCTAGTSTNGCVPAISSTGTPSVAATSGFSIDIANVEGQQSGLIFYGINGRVANPWGQGLSFYCVKSPVERMGVQNSGGTFGACDGSMSTDWLAFVASHPTAIGVPFSSGDVVNAQGWYRDPPSPKTTNLSDGLEFTLVP